MKSLSIYLLAALTFCSVSSTFAAKEVFERTKPHVNVGSIGKDVAPLTLALAVAAGNTTKEVFDERTGTVTALVETELFEYEIKADTNGGLAGEKASDAYFVKVDRETTTQSQTREHILLARQVGVPLVVFIDIDSFKSTGELEQAATTIHELLHGVGYSSANSGVVIGSVEAALKGEKSGLLTLIELMDTFDRCLAR